MRSTKSGDTRLAFFTIVMIIGMVISGKLIYSEISESIDLINQSKLGLRTLGHLDQLNSSLTFIERNEKPYLIAHNKKSIDEIAYGYKMAFTAFDSLSKNDFKTEVSSDELNSLKAIVQKKLHLSNQIIQLSLSNKSDSALKLIKQSDDSLLVRNFYVHYNNINNVLKSKINQQQDVHLSNTERIYEILLVTFFLVAALLLYSVFRLEKQNKYKDELLLQNKTFTDIINFSSDSILIHNKDFSINYCNKATEELFGYRAKEILGKDTDILFKTISKDEFIKERRYAIQHYGFWMGELKRECANGNILDLHITLNSFKNQEGEIQGYFSIASDITKIIKAQNEIKHLADSLEEVNHHLKEQVASQTALIKDVFERVQDVFIGTDNSLTINYASRHIESIFGLSFEKVSGMSIKEFLIQVAGFDYADAPKIAHDSNQNIRFEFIHKQSGYWFEANIYPSINGISIHFKNINEKVKSEEEILKSKRMYEFISKANEQILIAKNAEDLFKNICDVAITFENILFCWVGAPDPQNGKMTPIQFAGKEEGYLTAIKTISVYDEPEGKGPTGIAYRTGKYYYVNDIATDPVMVIWREEALKRGYRSDISLPIKVNEAVAYVFTIYTSKPY